MKRVFIALTALASYNVSIAQISKGGIPISFSQHNITRATSTMYKSPTYDEYEKVLNETLKANPFGAYNLGINFPMDIKFPESGTFHYAANGDVIWTAKITIAGAPATTFIYNDFMLPKGVKMYLYNSNRKQVLGAYTQENNSPDDRQFATEPVIGETVTIELNIDNNVNINDIALNINKGLVYYTGYEHLNYYLVNDDASKPTDPDQLGLEGRSSHCMINAKCPQAAGYEEARKASLQTIYTVGNGGACTGTMINSAGNTASNCKQYLLTASHCEETGSMTNSSHFSTMLLRYNFEKTECNSSTPAQVNTLTGANLIARSPYAASAPAETMDGDFMLLEAKSAVPESWNVNLVGFDRNTNYPAATSPKKYIGFHYPAGDIKKLLWNNTVSSSAMGLQYSNRFVQINLPYDKSGGGAAPGSSGSGLFNPDGRIIGDASTANGDIPECSNFSNPMNPIYFMTTVNYAKITASWEFNTANNQQLKHWLDPNNTNAMTTNTVKSTCAGLPNSGVSINNIDADFDKSINVYPNPSTNGNVTVQLNMKEAAKVVIDIYNVAGAKVGTINLGTITNTKQVIDLSQYANGMYILKFNNGSTTVNKKVMLVK